MKKVILVGSILLVAVLSTACINKWAVQDLNNKAKIYADKGDYTQAIERLKSSIDLDPTIFETHYNLAVVYTQAEDYINAVEEYKKVIEMQPNNADSYYSLGTAENNLAVDMAEGKARMNPDGSLYAPKPEDIDYTEKFEPSEEEKAFIDELYNSATANFEKYLELNPEAKDKADVETLIQKIYEAQHPIPKTVGE
jgi:tetratricopeptide (TPR) repeat protein